MIEVGNIKVIISTVKEEDTAKAVGSGTLRVLATPRMIALMEECAYKCIGDSLDAGTTSVGTLMDVKHLAATPVGMKIMVNAQVTEIDGRKITFKVSAADDSGLIGEGTHERFIVYEEKFLEKTYSKLK